jgi:hypothetical protein
MVKEDFKNRIRAIVKQVYKAQSKIDLDVPKTDISLDLDKFPILAKFPTLRNAIVQLLTTQYKDFVSEIQWIAPKPTTFKILLANNQFFYLLYDDITWICKSEGKKYWLNDIKDEGRATESIARLLSYGASKDANSSFKDSGDEAATEAPTETPAEVPAV